MKAILWHGDQNVIDTTHSALSEVYRVETSSYAQIAYGSRSSKLIFEQESMSNYCEQYRKR